MMGVIKKLPMICKISHNFLGSDLNFKLFSYLISQHLA